MIRITALFVVVAAAVGCGERPPSETAVAVVNGQTISLRQFESQLGTLSSIPGKAPQTNEAKRAFLKEIVRQELLFQAALKENFLLTSDRLRKEIALEYLGEKVGRGSAEPTDDAVKAYFESKKADLEEVRASHILFRPKNPDDPKSWEEAKARAESVLAKIRAAGPKADFAKFAVQYGEDEMTRETGGDLKFFKRAGMVPEFSEAAFGLKKPGDLAGPVRTQYGWHVVQLTGDRRGFERFAPTLREQMILEGKRTRAEALLKRLEDDAKVRIFDDALAAAKTGASVLPPPK
jgi:parvulin-like peptidyl-prolyl isomerase